MKKIQIQSNYREKSAKVYGTEHNYIMQRGFV